MTAESTPVRREDVAGAAIDGEMVLYDEATGRLHRLSPTATAIWLCLDGSGTLAEIAADLAEVFGAPLEQVQADVVQTVKAFAEQELLEGTSDRTEDRPPVREDDADSPFVVEASAPCPGTPRPLASLTVRVGSHLLGMRFNNEDVARAARAVFAPSAVFDVEAPSNVSVVATEAAAGRSLLWCYRSSRLIGRHRGPRRAMQAAAALLSSDGTGHDELARLAALLVVRDGRAALLSSATDGAGAALSARLRRAGWQVHDAPWLGVDRRSGEVVVPDWAVDVDVAALADLPSDPADLEPPAPGSYPVLVWIDVDTYGESPATPAGRVARAAADAVDIGTDVAGVLSAVELMLAEAEWMTVRDYDARQIVEAVERLAG